MIVDTISKIFNYYQSHCWRQFCLSIGHCTACSTNCWIVNSQLLFFSLAVLDPRVDRTLDVGLGGLYFLHLSLSSVILIDFSTESPVHVFMLSIQAVCGLSRLCAPGIVPCIISLSR